MAIWNQTALPLTVAPVLYERIVSTVPAGFAGTAIAAAVVASVRTFEASFVTRWFAASFGGEYTHDGRPGSLIVTRTPEAVMP